MPRTRSLAWAELRIGLLTIAAVAITVITVFMLTGSRGFFWQRYSLKTRFSNVAGLKSGSPVRVAGVEVGSVDSVQLAGEQVDVTFEVNKSYQDRITTTSTATLGSVSLLGEAAVDITPSARGTPIPEWGYVPQGRPAALLADVTNQASQGIGEITSMVHDIREGRGTVGRLMTDDQLYTELNHFVVSATTLTEGLKQGKGTLGKLLNDRQAADALEASLKNLQEVTGQLNAGGGSLGKLLKDDAFAKSLTSTTTNLDAVAARLNRGEGTAGKLINDPALFDRMSSTTQRLDQLLARLNDGEGTAGQLLKDKQLYENMNKVVTELHTLITRIEKDPRKYLNVKVSIF